MKKSKDCTTLICQWANMIKEGHVKLVDTDIDAPLKVQKAVAVDKIGEDFLNGKN